MNDEDGPRLVIMLVVCVLCSIAFYGLGRKDGAVDAVRDFTNSQTALITFHDGSQRIIKIEDAKYYNYVRVQYKPIPDEYIRGGKPPQ